MTPFRRFKKVLRTLARRGGYDVVRFGPMRDEWIAQRALLAGVDRPVIFDVGANEGQTLRSYARLFPEGHIHCFEPNPVPCRELERVAGGSPRVTIHRVALADAAGKARFHTHPRFTHEGSLYRRPADRKAYFNPAFELTEEFEVEIATIDSICAGLGIERLHLLKLDIQGGEFRALRGAERMLSEGRIDLIFAETSFAEIYEAAPLFPRIDALLAEHGFALYSFFNLFYARDGQLRYCDALFLRSAIRRQVLDTLPS